MSSSSARMESMKVILFLFVGCIISAFAVHIYKSYPIIACFVHESNCFHLSVHRSALRVTEQNIEASLNLGSHILAHYLFASRRFGYVHFVRFLLPPRLPVYHLVMNNLNYFQSKIISYSCV